jgi:hypothetical protein
MRSRIFKWCFLYCLILNLHLFAQEGVEIRLVVDLKQTIDIYDGIGAVSAGASSRLLIDYPEPYRSQILDFLFKPNYGAALQHLKVEIGGDINSTDGSEPSHMRTREDENYERGYEWWLMKEAKKRNPDIILDALAWGAPGWIGDGNYYSQDGADYMVKFLKGAKEHHGLEINYVGIWNEKEFDVEWIKLFRRTLDESGLSQVKIVASDMNGPPHKMWEIADSMVVDKELKDAVHAIGIHYAHGETPASALKLRAEGKRLWSTEDGEWNWFTMLPYRHERAQKLNLNYIDRRLTKTEFWSPVTSYYDCLPAPGSGMIRANTPWSGAYELERTLWAVAHTTQFVKPGWQYLENGCFKLPKGGSVVSLADPEGKQLSVIIETTHANGFQEVVIDPQGLSDHDQLHLWVSDDLQDFIQEADVVRTDGVFRIRTKPRATYTLTTTTGQQKGTATGPNPAAFPLPYIEDFDNYPSGKVPKYLSDQSGAYEVSTVKRGNKAVVQQIYRKGIDWSRTETAFSLIGEMNWTDIEVSADVMFPAFSREHSGELFASVIARGYQGAVWAAFQVANPVGYNFRLYADGRWKLLTADEEIAAGSVNVSRKEWVNLKIACRGSVISGYINGDKVCEVNDPMYRRGLAGIGSSFDPVMFDNLKITE